MVRIRQGKKGQFPDNVSLEYSISQIYRRDTHKTFTYRFSD